VPSELRSDFKELVRARTDIVQLVGERVALQSRRGGREFVGLCPFHDDHNPSLRVDPERQSYKCWACGEGGDCFTFVQKVENVEFRDALELLATRAGLELPRYRGKGGADDGKPTRKELFDVLAWAESEFHTCLRTSSEAKGAREYLEGRRVSRETIEKFRLGYAPREWQFLQDRCRGRFSQAALAAARLIAERDDSPGYRECFVDRVMFPIRDASGRSVAFGGRVLPSPAPSFGGKYINSQDSALFAKNRVVYALDLARGAIIERGAAVVMEGYADCIMAHQFGIANAVATLGTALTENHVAVLKRFTRKVVLVFDGDEAGRKAAEKSLPRFLGQDIDLRILTLEGAKDPADFLLAHGAEALGALIESAPESWEYKLRLCIERIGLGSVDAREQVVREMIDLFRQAPGFGGSPRENIIIAKLAFLVGMPELRARKMLHDARKQAKPAQVHEVAVKDGVAAGDRFSLAIEREVLELVFADPDSIATVRSQVAVEDFEHEAHRRLLETCYRLAERGVLPSFENVRSATEDAELGSLIMSLDASAREKARKLRIDSGAEGDLGRPALLAETIGRLRRRQRVAAHAATRGELARESARKATGTSDTGANGTLDPAQIELLRQAAEIHGERATARTTT
jgi:DNA primase